MERLKEIFVIHIEKIETRVPKGYFMNPYEKDYVYFYGLGVMVLKINRILQKIQAQSGRDRHIYHNLIYGNASFRPHKYFYILEVYYMENSSWQGRLIGTGCPKTCFKSVLDMLEKIDESMHVLKTKKVNVKG